MSSPKTRGGNASWLLPPPEAKDEVVRFRVSAGQKKSWEQALDRLGVRDLSAFCRGAVEAAIVMSERADDPAWKKFLTDIQGAAKKRFGAGMALHGARDYEHAGRGVRGVPAAEVFGTEK